MARPKNTDLQKHTLNLRAGDMEKLATFHSSPSVAVRTVVAKYVDHLIATSEPTSTPDVDVEI